MTVCKGVPPQWGNLANKIYQQRMTTKEIAKAKKYYAAAAPIMGSLLGHNQVIMKLDPDKVPEDRAKAADILMRASKVAITSAIVLERGVLFQVNPEEAKEKYAPKEEVKPK